MKNNKAGFESQGIFFFKPGLEMSFEIV